jgi:integrase
MRWKSKMKDARRWERHQQHALDTGVFVRPSTEQLGALLTSWLDGAAALSVRSRTLSDYRELVTRYVATHPVARVKVVDLRTEDLERFYGELSARPLSARTVRMVHAVLHAALARAVKSRRLAVNPAAGATLPRQARHEVTVLSAEQLSRLLAVSEETGNRWHALWHLLANSGLRPSEALGLRWDDLGPDYIHVRRTLVVARKGGGWTLEEPKTRRSRRVVTLPAATIEALAVHRVQQEIEKIAAGSGYTDHGFVFASQTGGPLSLPNLTSRHFKPLLTAYYQLPDVNLYALRHSHASLALSAGVPVHVVSARLGHASAVMTLNVYAHAVPGQDADAAESVAARLGNGRVTAEAS